MPLRPRLVRRALAAALCAAAALPAAASADSLIYIAGGNVWLTTTDGARQFQVTTDGGWDYASQSDNGVIVASKGSSLYRLARTGEVVGKLSTVSRWPWFGPYDAQVSPDGTRVAYGYFHQGTSTTSGVMYTNTDGTSPDFPFHSGWTWPAWYDNEWTLHSERPPGGEQFILRRAGDPNNEGEPWDENEGHEVFDADIKPGVIAAVAGGGTVLPVYRFTGAPAAKPSTIEGCMQFEQPTGGKLESPTLSGNGRGLWWNEGDGIWGTSLPDFSGGCAPVPNGRLIVAGGRFPDWGGADVPPARVPVPPPPPAPPVPTPTPAPAPAPVPSKPRAKAAPITLAGKVGLAKALAKGLTVTVGGASGTVKVTASVSAATAKKAGLGKKAVTVASGSAKAKGGTAKVTLKFAKAKARKLKRLKSLPLTLRLADGRTSTVTLVK